MDFETNQVTGLVSSYNTETDTWYQEPTLNEKRHSHSAVALESNLFVVGGRTKIGAQIKSIELLSVDAKQVWELFVTNNELVGRQDAIAVAISNKELAIFGGEDDEREQVTSGYVLDTHNGKITEFDGKF